MQDSYNDVSWKRGGGEYNSSSNEDSRKHKIAKLHIPATAAKLVLCTLCITKPLCSENQTYILALTPDAGLVHNVVLQLQQHYP